MTVIAREVPSVWVLSHPEFGIRPVLKTTSAAELRRHGWEAEEYVPASQVRGAVEGIAEAKAITAEVLDTWVWPIRDFSEMRDWLRRLNAALDRAEGRSESVDRRSPVADDLPTAVAEERSRIVRAINRAAISHPRSSPERIALLDAADLILKGER